MTARYYASDLPFAALFGSRSAAWINPITRYYEDCFNGTLPNITIVDPPFKDGSGGDGLSADEHPLGDVRLGQAFMADVVNAFVNSKNYQRGALFVIYDEWGGFFDHVRPPRVPDDRASNNPENDFGQMGFRVPAVAVSPYARRGKKKWPWERDRYGWHRNHFEVDHGLYGHESILKFISYRFGLGDLNTRMKFANNIGRSFDFWRPDFERPQLPDPPEIVTAALRARAAATCSTASRRTRATSPTSSTWPSATGCPSTTASSATSSRCRTRSRRASSPRPGRPAGRTG